MLLSGLPTRMSRQALLESIAAESAEIEAKQQQVRGLAWPCLAAAKSALLLLLGGVVLALLPALLSSRLRSHPDAAALLAHAQSVRRGYSVDEVASICSRAAFVVPSPQLTERMRLGLLGG